MKFHLPNNKKTMKSKKNTLFVAGFISFLIMSCILSCEKEGEKTNPCQDPTKIRQLKENGVTWEDIIYNDKCEVYEYLEAYSYKKYIYNSQNQLVKIEQAMLFNPMSCFMPAPGEIYTDPRETPITQYQEFEYDSEGKISKKLFYFKNSESFNLVSYQTFEYENNLPKQINLFNPENKSTEKYIYTYDNNGNVLSDKYYTCEEGKDFTLVYTNKYEYDDKINPFTVFSFDGNPGKYTNKNNITKNIYINGYSEQEYTYSRETSYEYNETGYPVKINSMDVVYGN